MAVPVAPAAGAGIEGIAGLGLVLAFVVCLALRNVWKATIGWVLYLIADLFDRLSFTILHTTVGVPKAVGHALRAASDNVASALGYLALRSENGAVWLFNQAYQQLRWVGREIEGLANDTYRGINDLIHHEIPAQVGTLRRTFTRRLHGIDATLGRLDHFAHAQVRRLSHGIDRLAHAVTHTLPQAIHATNTRVGTTAKQLRRLARRTSALERATIGAGAVALVGTALTGLGLKWLKCPALGRVGRKLGCGGFGLIEEFLSTTFEALIVIDLCRFAIGAQRLAALVVPQLGAVLLVPEAVCLGGGAQLPSAHDSPKTTVRITLPSAHD